MRRNLESRSIIKKFRTYTDLLRPFTLLAPLIVSIFIMMASFYYTNSGSLTWNLLFLIISSGIILVLLNGASNTLNQITDLKTDEISKPYRPIPKKTISIKEAKFITVFLYFTSIALSYFINLSFFLLVLLITFFTLTYSLPPRCKDKLFINQLWVGIPRGLLGILASWSVFSNPLQALPLAIGLIAMLFLVGGSITKDITDSEADKKTGTNTLINTYGIKKAALMAFPFMVFPFSFIPLLIDSKIIEPHFVLLTFLVVPASYIFYLMIKDSSKRKRLENTSSWALMYTTYFFFAFGFSVLTIAGKTVI